MELIFGSEGSYGSAQRDPEEEYHLPGIVLWLIIISWLISPLASPRGTAPRSQHLVIPNLMGVRSCFLTEKERKIILR